MKYYCANCESLANPIEDEGEGVLVCSYCAGDIEEVLEQDVQSYLLERIRVLCVERGSNRDGVKALTGENKCLKLIISDLAKASRDAMHRAGLGDRSAAG